MPKGLSLHIGINHYNKKEYRKNHKHLQPMPNCHRDAEAQKEIAKRFRFNCAILLNEDATKGNVIAAIRAAAWFLENGDMFFLSFSGHGGRVEERIKDDDDDEGHDQTWCLYDAMLIDDEIFELLKLFRPGVRILVIADSCFSGSSIKSEDSYLKVSTGKFPVEKTGDIQAACLLLAACQDTQFAYTGYNINYSLYTYWLLKELEEYEFIDNYRDLHNRVALHMPENSKPNLFKFGPGADRFERKRPFII